jgi:uncharacterized membrane protein
MKSAFALFTKYFLRGLLVLAPIGITLWILWCVFVLVDQILPLPDTWARGIGFVLVVLLVCLVGVLASSYLATRLLTLSDRLFERLPLVKLLYHSIKDLTQAFVGGKKTFDRPVVVELANDVRVVGFVMRDDLRELGLERDVAVYVPQSYNFAANLLLVPRTRVRPIDRPASEVLAFVVSGGLTSVSA